MKMNLKYIYFEQNIVKKLVYVFKGQVLMFFLQKVVLKYIINFLMRKIYILYLYLQV